MRDTVLVTGGAGFIGSALVRLLIEESDRVVVNVDVLTYSGSLENVATVSDSPRYHFEHASICDADALGRIFERYQPTSVVHLAAESHVDRSIDGPRPFVDTNVFGTFTLLESCRRYLAGLVPQGDEKSDAGGFRFVHVSTDEVFGSLGAEGKFNEATAYDPSSPYSASKASADHLVRAWHRTFGVPAMITNCSNNYGPFQYPEKLIPVVILNLLAEKDVPVYGSGENVRDWLYVEDHARALVAVLEDGTPGETYVVGASNERTNLELIRQICTLMDELAPRDDGRSHSERISHVADRPGHDFRYAIDAAKISSELGWKPLHTHNEALRKTVRWYLDNQQWCARRLEHDAGFGDAFQGTRRIGLGSIGSENN